MAAIAAIAAKTAANSRRLLSLPSLLSLLSLLSLGCGGLFKSYDVAPNGLVRSEERFRNYLQSGAADSALLQLGRPVKKSRLPGDELLRSLFEGVASHYSGDYARSVSAFDRASLLAEDRATKSVSRAALSLLVNDLSLAFEPSRTERLMLPYYAALTYAQAGKYDDAAVEARRLSLLLQSIEDNSDATDRRLHAFLRYFAGTLFEAAGQHTDADVAYRNARALDSLSFPASTALSGDSCGDLVVLIEHGFVPHRVQESLFVMLADFETHEFWDDDSDDARRASASRIAERVVRFAGTSGPRTGPPRSRTLWVPAPAFTKASRSETRCDSAGKCREEHEDHSYLLRMSWPMMYAPERAPTAFAVLMDSLTVGESVSADVAGGVLNDFQREQPAIVARTVARAAAKYLLTKSAKKSAGKKHEALGDVVGTLANITTSITEQADTRSWHLLPAQITLVRVRAPAGQHQLRIRGTASDSLDLGTVMIQPGRLSLVSTRIWQ